MVAIQTLTALLATAFSSPTIGRPATPVSNFGIQQATAVPGIAIFDEKLEPALNITPGCAGDAPECDLPWEGELFVGEVFVGWAPSAFIGLVLATDQPEGLEQLGVCFTLAIFSLITTPFFVRVMAHTSDYYDHSYGWALLGALVGLVPGAGLSILAFYSQHFVLALLVAGFSISTFSALMMNLLKEPKPEVLEMCRERQKIYGERSKSNVGVAPPEREIKKPTDRSDDMETGKLLFTLPLVRF